MSQAWYVPLAHGALQDLPAVTSAQPGAGVMMAGGTLGRHLEGCLNILSPKLVGWQTTDAKKTGPLKTPNLEPMSFWLGRFKFRMLVTAYHSNSNLPAAARHKLISHCV